MSKLKRIKLEHSYLEATYYGTQVEIYDTEGLDLVFVSKQDLIAMLKLFEEQEE